MFETFNCKTFGDDMTKYLVLDQSVSCETNKHTFWQIYAGFMMFVYPIGTPALYLHLLWKDRAILKDEVDREKDDNRKLLASAFLWDQYNPEFWWFDVYDCIRRLSQTGLLIFVFKGQATQIVFAMLISAVSAGAFINWKPFLKDHDNNLAIAVQGSIFLTLFYALLTKVGIDKDEQYNESMFGALLVFINLLGVILVLLAALNKPARKLKRALARKHVHDAPIKGVTAKHKRWPLFTAYFFDLIKSTEEEAGWMKIDKKHFGKKGKGTTFLEENKGEIERGAKRRADNVDDGNKSRAP